MTCDRFEDLPGWQKAAELYEPTENLLENQGLKVTSGVREQLDRAALSDFKLALAQARDNP